jgi:hypothetical protein
VPYFDDHYIEQCKDYIGDWWLALRRSWLSTLYYGRYIGSSKGAIEVYQIAFKSLPTTLEYCRYCGISIA